MYPVLRRNLKDEVAVVSDVYELVCGRPAQRKSAQNKGPGVVEYLSGRSRDRHPRYGCPQNFYRGTCANDLKERRDWLEDQLLSKIQNEVLNPEAVEYTIEEFGRQLRAALGDLSGEMARMREQKAKLEGEIANLTAAVAAAVHSPALLSGLAQREGELQAITERLLAEGKGSIEADLADIRRFVTEQVGDLRRLLSEDVALARTELAKHVGQITMEPDLAKRHYTAKGEWSLIGTREFSGRVGFIAGAGSKPATFGL